MDKVAAIVPGRGAEQAQTHRGPAGATTCAEAEGMRQRRLGWAKLMARVFDIDVLACPRCHSRMQMIAFITHPQAIRGILQSVGLATAPPEPARAVLLEDELGASDWS